MRPIEGMKAPYLGRPCVGTGKSVGRGGGRVRKKDNGDEGLPTSGGEEAPYLRCPCLCTTKDKGGRGGEAHRGDESPLPLLPMSVYHKGQRG